MVARRPAARHDGDMSNGAYAAAYEQSISDPNAFWGKAAEAIEWITPEQ